MPQRYLTFLLPLLCLAFGRDRKTSGQDAVTEEPCKYYYHKGLKKNVYTSVEIEAEFPGGTPAYMRYLNKHLRYPEEMANEENWQSSVRATCIIDTDGRIIDPQILNKSDTSEYSPLDKHFIQIINTMPKWTPAICNGKKVASEQKIMVTCFLPETSD